MSEHNNEEITPNQIKTKPMPIKKKSVEGQKSVDEYTTTAKALVLKNYTEHQVPRGNPEITLDDLFLVWFTKTLSNWKCLVATIYADGLYYEVIHNGNSHETYVDIYRRLGHSKVSDKDKNALLEQITNNRQ